MLDRNGLRPSRYWVTEDGLVVLASEVGVLDLDPATVVRKGRLQPGRMFLVDTDRGRIVDDAEIKAELAAEAPYDEWLHAGQLRLADLPEREHVVHTHASVIRRQQTFGYTEEELRILLTPMARAGAEPIGSMGTDTPVAVLSQRPRLLFDYFSQLFAQVTNPPLDAIREELVTCARHSDRPGPEPARPRPRRTAGRWCSASRSSTTTSSPRSMHINRDGDLPGLRHPSDPRALPGRRRRTGAARRAGRHLRWRSPRRSPPAPGSSCCPTATPTPTGRRSRRCCSPPPCTTT